MSPTAAPLDPVPASPGVSDALALIAAGELASFARLADDAAHAPDLRSRIMLSRMAAGDLAPLDRIEQRAYELGVGGESFDDLVWGSREMLAQFDARTVPRDWWERLIKTYIGYGIIADLQRELLTGLDETTRKIANEALGDNGHADFVVATLSPYLAGESQLGSRLALWGRRVVGEGLGVAQRLLLGTEGLAVLTGVVQDGQRPTAEAIGPVLGRLTSEHARRMKRLNLTA